MLIDNIQPYPWNKLESFVNTPAKGIRVKTGPHLFFLVIKRQTETQRFELQAD
tara:strand:- start:1712 stop:1870 length:159 start_codon:yes stop_codon:yes gene_type:complete